MSLKYEPSSVPQHISATWPVGGSITGTAPTHHRRLPGIRKRGKARQEERPAVPGLRVENWRGKECYALGGASVCLCLIIKQPDPPSPRNAPPTSRTRKRCSRQALPLDQIARLSTSRRTCRSLRQCCHSRHLVEGGEQTLRGLKTTNPPVRG